MRGNLTLLVDPIYSAKRVSRCSGFFLLNLFADAFMVAFPDSRVTCLVPDSSSKFDVDVPLNKPGWSYVPVHYGRDRYQELFWPSDQHLGVITEYGGSHGDWDVLLTCRQNGWYFRNTFSNTSQTVKMICLLELFPQFEFKKTTCSGNKSEGVPISLRYCSSYLEFDSVYITCDYERNGVLREARQVLSPAMRRALMHKLKVYHPSFDDLSIEYPLTIEAQERFLTPRDLKVLYTQRIGLNQRKFPKVFNTLSSIFALLNSSGRDISLALCTNSAADLPEYAARDSGFFVMEKPPRDEFLKILLDSHVFLSFSVDEGLPTGLVEAFMQGMIGVLYRAGWSKDLCGNDYPFLVNSEDEALACVKYIYDNRDVAWGLFTDWYRTYFVPKFSNRPGVDLFVDDVSRHFERETLNCEGYVNPIGMRVLSNTKVGDTVDIMHLDYPDVSERRDLRKVDLRDTGYFLLPRRWVSHYWLRARQGFTLTDKPWVLRRTI